MTDRPIIELTGLTIRYGAITAVEELSLKVPQGSVYALLGRNGSGKSSTVRCLLGQQLPTAGTARVFGLDAWQDRRRIMSDVGVVPETPNIPPEMTALQLERFLVRIAIRWDRYKFFSRLERFGVPTGTRFSRLSKGQQKQLSLTAAISSSPQILILDDPTLGLDPVARRELFEELVVELADRGTTVFMTTHDLAGVESIADRVGIIKNGHLFVDEELESLKARFRRITWTPPPGAPGNDIPVEVLAMNVLTSQPSVGNTCDVIVQHFDDSKETGDISVRAVSLEEMFVALCGENGGA